jgi:exopolyphosphatase/guanosine-5'-triphosphate,3'-diphosphate pyrophosphatase
VAEFSKQAREMNVSSTRVIATSAARDANNQQDLVQAISQASGLKVEIISGQQEAEWVFRGVCTDPALSGIRVLILDVGGGSTEIILGDAAHHSFRQSFALGSVRLLEKLQPSDPPGINDLVKCRSWLEDFFAREITSGLESALKALPATEAQLVGTGGTITILARMEKKLEDFERERIEGTRLSRQRILELMVYLWSLSLAERKKIAGLPPKRADVILMGVAIYEAVMEHFRLPDIYVSTRGLRFGAVLDNPTPE